MKNNRIKYAVGALTFTMAASLCMPQLVQADGVDKPYLAIGADLNSTELAQVYALLGVDSDHLDDYEIVKITNQDEHDYLDDYLKSDIIGSRALSSVLIEKTSEGSGIHVDTHNITYCSEGMYENALTTAGIADADVTVAGPFDITGTAALVGAMKAYEDMTGEEIDEEVKDTATNELVVTGELAEEIGDSDTAEQFIAMLKEYIAEHSDADESDIEDAIESCEEELDFELTEDQEKQISDLMEKLGDIDIDVDQLKEQAQEIYDKLSDIEIDSQGFFDKIMQMIKSIFDIFGK